VDLEIILLMHNSRANLLLGYSKFALSISSFY
jgi:hypothetical protein